MFHPAKHTNYGTAVPGDMNIGSWFRPYPLEMQLWGNSGEIKFQENEPLFYVEFDTDKDIILKRFNFNQNLHNYAKHCTTFYNQEYSLIKRYNQFKRTKMNKNTASYSRVSDGVNCPRCKENKAVKNGRTRSTASLIT